MNYYFDRDIPAETELQKADIYAERYYDLVRLEKTYSFTWNNGSGSSYKPGNLDHCYAAKHMKLPSRAFPKACEILLLNGLQNQDKISNALRNALDWE